jgi:queuosine precursor transporter
MQDNDLKLYVFLVGMFVGSLTIAAVLASKIITIFGFFVPAGVFAYCITFVCTDAISEVWGKRRANYTVFAGLIALTSAFFLIQISIYWPSAAFWNHDDSFNIILGMTPRIILGSLIAYVLSQFYDVWFFHLIKNFSGVKHLWLRNNLSTATSQFFDSAIFVAIAFYGILPIWPIILGQWIIKLIIAIIDTPIVYAFVWFINYKNSKMNDRTSSVL